MRRNFPASPPARTTHRPILFVRSPRICDVPAWVPSVRFEPLGELLEASKPNGHDRHPFAPASPSPKLRDHLANARAAERRLLAAMREYPGLSTASLAKAVGARLSATKERLRRMNGQELIEKAPDGRWQVRGEEPHPCRAKRGAGPCGTPYDAAVELTAGPEPEPVDLKPASPHAPWIRPIGDYERRETTIVEGLRYG